MKRYFLGTALVLVGFSTLAIAQQPPTPAAKPATDSAKPAAPKKQTVADKTKGNKKVEGLFTIYQDTVTGSLQMYIRKILFHLSWSEVLCNSQTVLSLEYLLQ